VPFKGCQFGAALHLRWSGLQYHTTARRFGIRAGYDREILDWPNRGFDALSFCVERAAPNEPSH
jgi:hypothetical protein